MNCRVSVHWGDALESAGELAAGAIDQHSPSQMQIRKDPSFTDKRREQEAILQTREKTTSVVASDLAGTAFYARNRDDVDLVERRAGSTTICLALSQSHCNESHGFTKLLAADQRREMPSCAVFILVSHSISKATSLWTAAPHRGEPRLEHNLLAAT